MHTASALYLRLCIHLWLSCYLSPYGAEGLLRNDEGSLATGRDPAGAELRLTFTPIQTSTQLFQERSTDAAEIANRRETRGVQATCQSTTVEKVKLWMPLTVAMLFHQADWAFHVWGWALSPKTWVHAQTEEPSSPHMALPFHRH